MIRPGVTVVLTQSPYSSRGEYFFKILKSIVSQASEVRIYLTYDGVLAVDDGGKFENNIRDFSNKGATILVDEKELSTRGLTNTIQNLKVSDNLISKFVDELMTEDRKVIVM